MIFGGPETAGWRVGPVEDGSVHVEPVDDVMEHQVDECMCGPKTEPVERDDGSVGWLITHYSLDGREQHE